MLIDSAGTVHESLMVDRTHLVLARAVVQQNPHGPIEHYLKLFPAMKSPGFSSLPPLNVTTSASKVTFQRRGDVSSSSSVACRYKTGARRGPAPAMSNARQKNGPLFKVLIGPLKYCHHHCVTTPYY